MTQQFHSGHKPGGIEIKIFPCKNFYTNVYTSVMKTAQCSSINKWINKQLYNNAIDVPTTEKNKVLINPTEHG